MRAGDVALTPLPQADGQINRRLLQRLSDFLRPEGTA
jgi:hypothetical protein